MKDPAARARARGGDGRGGAVQVDPIKSTLKAPRSSGLKLEHEKLLSTSAFKFKLRRYTAELLRKTGAGTGSPFHGHLTLLYWAPTPYDA
jgi:hypothetical protein